MMKKGIVFVLAVMLLLTSTGVVVSAAYDNTYVNSGNGADDLVGVAKTQVGYLEGTLEGNNFLDNNYQKYGVWYDETVENIDAATSVWDAAFIAWCADQANIPVAVLPRNAYVPYSTAWFQNKGLLYDSQSRGGSYIPKKGDLIYFASAESTVPTHMGIVTEVTDTYVRTIEGNATDPSDAYGLTQGVFTKRYNLNYTRIFGYATPQYETNPYANTYVNSGNGAEDIVGVAKTQVGYIEGSLTGDRYGNNDNCQKYGAWYDEAVENIDAANSPWAATFVSWCADQAGIAMDMIPPYVYIPYSANWYRNKGLFEDSQSRGGAYVPKKGDLIYFAPAVGNTPSHMGIVTAADDTYVYTIEGNAYAQSGEQTTEGVQAKKYLLSYTRIFGYATPDYDRFDMNGDGKVSTADVRTLLLAVLDDDVSNRMDIDGSGEVNTADARALLKTIVGE